MNGKALIPLVAGLGIGGFALWMGLNTLKSAKGAQKPVEKVQVWGAKQDIPRGTRITEDALVALAFPRALVPEGAFTEKEELLERVPKIDAPANLPILESMLAPAGTPAGLFVKAGFRAVAVKIDASSGVDYHLVPGSFVDVVGSFTVRRDREQETVAKTIVENVEVAAVGQRLSAVQDEEGSDKNNPRNIRAVTLFVRPDDVPKLLLAEQKGKIKLSLRNDTDAARGQEREPVSDRELTGDAAPATPPPSADNAEAVAALLGQLRDVFTRPRPAQPESAVVAAEPPPPWVVSIYRGQEREVLRFQDRESRELAPAEAPAPRGAARAVPGGPLSRAGQANPKFKSPSQTDSASAEPEPKEFQE